MDAIAAARALETRTELPVRLLELPIDAILTGLLKSLRKLRVERQSSRASLDDPTAEAFLQLEWTDTYIEASFEGDSDKLMDKLGLALARFGCGAVYGDEYFAPSAPLGSTVTYFPQIEAEGRLYSRAWKGVAKLFPADHEAQKSEIESFGTDPSFRKKVDELARELENRYRKTKPRDIVARTKFYWFSDDNSTMYESNGNS